MKGFFESPVSSRLTIGAFVIVVSVFWTILLTTEDKMANKNRARAKIEKLHHKNDSIQRATLEQVYYQVKGLDTIRYFTHEKNMRTFDSIRNRVDSIEASAQRKIDINQAEICRLMKEYDIKAR